VAETARHHRRHGVRVLLPGGAGYPSDLVGDPGAPAVLFALGDPGAIEGHPRVAVVGTRSATPYGRQVASELAADLSAAGVVVVSGLARGIDGAAHAGVVRARSTGSAPPVAVVGTGLDVVYPASNRELWEAVATTGAVLSESTLGTPPHPRVFPARNRIIAALSDVVVVVECHRDGGSLYTVEAAARRSVPVCAVPGSVRSRASDGTNALLVDGCAPVRDASDVLVAVSLARTGVDHRAGTGDTGRPGSAGPGRRHALLTGRRAVRTGRVPTEPHQRAVWEAVDPTPTAFETILIRTDLPVAAAAEACDRLVEGGLLEGGAGWWSRADGSGRLPTDGRRAVGAGSRGGEAALLPTDGG
jgi:DNA processing protein